MNETEKREELIEQLLYLGVFKIDEKQLFEHTTAVLEGALANETEAK